VSSHRHVAAFRPQPAAHITVLTEVIIDINISFAVIFIEIIPILCHFHITLSQYRRRLHYYFVITPPASITFAYCFRFRLAEFLIDIASSSITVD